MSSLEALADLRSTYDFFGKKLDAEQGLVAAGEKAAKESNKIVWTALVLSLLESESDKVKLRKLMKKVCGDYEKKATLDAPLAERARLAKTMSLLDQ